MKEYTNPDPSFHETINIVDTSTPDNGDLISIADRQNLDNSLVLKNMVDELTGQVQESEELIEAKGAPVLIQEDAPSDTSALWVY